MLRCARGGQGAATCPPRQRRGGAPPAAASCLPHCRYRGAVCYTTHRSPPPFHATLAAVFEWPNGCAAGRVSAAAVQHRAPASLCPTHAQREVSSGGMWRRLADRGQQRSPLLFGWRAASCAGCGVLAQVAIFALLFFALPLQARALAQHSWSTRATAVGSSVAGALCPRRAERQA